MMMPLVKTFEHLCHSVCLYPGSQSHCLQVTCVTLHRPKLQRLSFLPSKRDFPQLKLPSTADCSQRWVPWEHDAKGRDQTEDTHTQRRKKSRRKESSRVTRRGARWKTAFFHMLLLSDLSRRKALAFIPEKSHSWRTVCRESRKNRICQPL